MGISKIFKRGQVTLLVLLLGMLGLTVALAAASRSLQDINQVSQTDQGTQALAGAEAALQYGISKYDPSATYLDCGAVSYSPAGSTFPGFSTPVQYKICQLNVTSFGQYLALPKDEVYQLNIPSTVNLGGGGNFNVLWKNDNPSAVEVSVVYQTAGGVLSLKRFAVNGTGYTPSPTNNFSASAGGCAAMCGNLGYTSCTASVPVLDAAAPAKIVRVRRFYSSGDVAVCAPVSLSVSNLVVFGTATTTSGTTRRVQASLSAPALPAVFDYALFTEGSLIK